MREREPVHIATQLALGEGLLTQGEIDQIIEDAKAEVEAVEAFADASEIARPDVNELMDGVFAK